MQNLASIRRSVLDLAFIPEGADVAEALRRSLDLACHVEALGYHRFWVAEHHNMVGIASAATSVLIGHLAAGTKTMRIGSGGIMLPNHAPLAIAEQFGTLESLFPGRIDLGLGRAPGGDSVAARALRRHIEQSGDDFPRLLEELRGYFRPAAPGQSLRAVPGAGLDVPIWLLSSSGFSAQLAGLLGLPFAFAGQFAPRALEESFALYREAFRPSEQWPEPYAAVGINIIAADTDAEARRLATSPQRAFLNLIRGHPGKLPPPVDSLDGEWSAPERAAVMDMLSASIIGDERAVREGVRDLITRTGANEVIVNAAIFDQAARRRSYEIVARAWDEPDDQL